MNFWHGRMVNHSTDIAVGDAVEVGMTRDKRPARARPGGVDWCYRSRDVAPRHVKNRRGLSVLLIVITVVLGVSAGSPSFAVTTGSWPGAGGPRAAHDQYGYPYPDAPACTAGGACDPDKWNFYQGQCTSWVAYRLNQLNKVAFSNSYGGQHWGDATNWGTAARNIHVAVNGTPGLGSVAWYQGTSGNDDGHVAYVEQVKSSSQVVISEMNYDFDNGFRVRTISTSSGWPTDFLHIKDVPTNTDPTGHFDSAQGRVGGVVRVQGWALDKDAPTTPIHVHIYIDGKAGSGARSVDIGAANVSRPDVGRAYPGTGSNHGFNTTISSVADGKHTLYAYAINTPTGNNPLIGSLTATVPGPDPIGRLDSVTGGKASADVSGWALDPDTPTSPSDVRVDIDGLTGSGAREVDIGTAAQSRPDIATAYPGAGPAHGYSATIDGISEGSHTFNVYAVDTTSGKLVLIASKSVTALAPNVPPVAMLNVTPRRARAHRIVNFDATQSSDSDGTVVSYVWDFGDHTTGTGATASHIYRKPGKYHVTLTVTDDDGAIGSAVVRLAVIKHRRRRH